MSEDEKKPKLIIMSAPVESTVLSDDNMPEGHPRGRLALKTMALGSQLVKECPEARMVIISVSTPRPAGVTGKFDENHTCIVSGEHPNTVEDLRKFLNRAIPSLISLRMRVETDPQGLADILKPQAPKKKEG